MKYLTAVFTLFALSAMLVGCTKPEGGSSTGPHGSEKAAPENGGTDESDAPTTAPDEPTGDAEKTTDKNDGDKPADGAASTDKGADKGTGEASTGTEATKKPEETEVIE